MVAISEIQLSIHFGTIWNKAYFVNQSVLGVRVITHGTTNKSCIFTFTVQTPIWTVILWQAIGMK